MTTVGDLVPYIAGALVIGGIGVALARRPELARRWFTWALALPIIVGALYLGRPGAAALAAVLGVVCAAEYGRLVRLPLADRVALVVLVAGLPMAAWLIPAQLPRLLAAAILVVAAVPLVAGDSEHGLRRLVFGVFGLVWLAPLTAVVLLGPTVLALFMAVSIADIAAYFGGRLLKGPHLSPVSPNKRWSGVLTGMIAGLATLAVLGSFTPALAVAVAIGAPVGDLIESMVKRGSGAKDAGAWIPGSGGLLDRVDSLLVALALTIVLS